MDPAKLKVVELRAELSKRGLDSKGNKPVLVERLKQALEEEKAAGGEAPEATPSESSHRSEKSESEDDAEDSKSQEPSRRQTRTPSRSSRQSSREPATPTRTTRRSSSRSSSRLSPAKTTISESSEVTPALEPIVEEDKSSPKKENVSLSPKRENVLRKESTPSMHNMHPELKQMEIRLEIVKEAEKHLSEKSQEITRKSTEDVSKSSLSPTKSVTPQQSPVKSPTPQDSPAKPSTPQQSSVKSVTPQQSPAKPALQSPSNTEATPSKQTTPIKTATQSPIQTQAQQSPVQSPVKQQPAQSPVQSPNKQQPAQSPVQSPNKQQSVQSPVKSPPAESPVEPEETPVKTPTQSPVKVPMQSPSKAQSPTKTSPQKKVEQSPVKEVSESSPCKKLKSDAVEPMESENTVEESEKDEKSNVKRQSESDKMDTDQQSDAKSDDQRDSDRDDKSSTKTEDRKRKRSPSPREEAPRPPPTARPENEPTYDENKVLLSWYDSDLHLVIDAMSYYSASPMQGEGFSYIWAGVRASHGFNKGKVFFEARVNAEFDNIAAAAAAGVTNTDGALPLDEEKIPSLLRVGWSTMGTSLQLGEDVLSYGYEGSGKKSTGNKFEEYGKKFGKGDIVGCYADFETNGKITLSYTINGESQEPAFTIQTEELEGKALFPHILSKNCNFTVNFGQEEPWSKTTLEGYLFVGKVDENDRVVGARRPEKRADCEVILLCGLPFSGKTSWATKHVADHPEKLYNVLGTHSLIEKMKVDGVPLKEKFKGRWENVVEKCSRALLKLLESAPSRRRNYILDQQANVYGSAQKRKMRNFYGFHRKAVVIVPSEEEFKERITKRNESSDGVEIRESSFLEVKANLNAPAVGESFEEVIWSELNEEEGKKLIETYNTEGKTAGYGQNQHQQSKRSRHDGGPNNRSRDNRRPGYNDRRSSGPGGWQRQGGGGGGGGGGGSWNRDGNRNRGGPMRGGSGGYGSPGGWRQGGRGGGSFSRNDDRRHGNGNRSGGGRQGGWSAVGYQGNQAGTGVWSQSAWQGQNQNWGGSGQAAGWGQQQQAWGGAAGTWKAYGQSQGQGYGGNSQAGYGNGSWGGSSQYYNQQQQWSQGGQTGNQSSQSGQNKKK